MPNTYIPGSLLSAVNAAIPDGVRQEVQMMDEKREDQIFEAPTIPTEKVEPQLSTEDRLGAEVLQLRIMVLLNSKADFLRSVERTIEERFDKPLSAMRSEVTRVQAYLGDKYGIDFKTQEIEPGTGRIITVKQ